jgi:hypothetical protein
MGGFVSADGHYPVATEEQLRLLPDYLAAIRSIREEDIEDRSKGDLLSKGVVLLQGLWFTIQCLARVHQHLPLTELEVATLAFQFVNIFIWLLWLHKPLDVQQPILLGPANEFVPLAELPESRPRLREIKAVVDALLVGYYDLDLSASTSVPSFWSTHGFGSELPGSAGIKMIFIQFFVGTVFGLVHCTAWNAHFPSTAELLIWRSCSLVIAATPFTLTLVFILFMLWEKLPLHWRRKTLMRSAANLLFDLYQVIIYATSAAYIAARLILIVLSFVTLRALPPGAFVDVNWSTYIPHL